MRTPVILLVTVVALAVPAGCGYTTDALHRSDIKTVAVPILQSQEFRRGLEYEMTQ
jgi:hypothetical protein